ncbi:MAG: sulfotransferase [Anaerolineae bacterium]|nr:sulfotransferase [Anaerolineae bacterium]
MPRPNFFIVGAPKCGTTAMYAYLNAHPDVFMCPIKEPHYFGSDFVGGRFKRAGGLAGYLALFDGAGEAQRIGEASIFYLFSQRAAQEIHDFDPDAKIIALLRSPVEMLYAWYYELRFQAEEPLPTFQAALEAEAERKQGHMIPPRLFNMPESLYYRDLAKFTAQVQRYFDVFGRDVVQVTIFDDLKTDTPGVYRRTLEFLDLDPDVAVTLDRVNVSKTLRFPALRRFLHAPPQWWYRGPVALGRALVPEMQRRRVNQWLQRLNARQESRPPMDPDLRRQLQADFRPEIEQLSALLDRDLTHWCADD